ncbi:MFS transporter [Nonomuraea sp. NEAU-A123]|uniref:MFS transporter n=1 Tax=Nonomuraea sp. NEAU-A123 TaxID=2839649 RepID=UPI001BE459BA|nr:MFS transporter [Nonomuraea sp. NEAU-A123]MBT2233646.1 MFS transporter [Nonomuraea sp. NEAU-A123]
MAVNDSLAPHGAALPPSSPRFEARAWGVTAVLVLSSVVVFLDKALLGLVAKPMSAELGMSAAGFGTLGSASYVLFGATCIAVSFAAQRISPRWVLLVCGLLWAVGQVPAVVAATSGMLYASRILVGAAEGPANPLSMTVLYSWFPNERRGLPQALYTAGAAVAKIALAPVLTLIIIGFGWRMRADSRRLDDRHAVQARPPRPGHRGRSLGSLVELTSVASPLLTQVTENLAGTSCPDGFCRGRSLWSAS